MSRLGVFAWVVGGGVGCVLVTGPLDGGSGASTYGPPPTGTVDVFFAAGVPSGSQSCHFTKFDSNAEACSIYRVRWDWSAGAVVEHEEVVDAGVGPWFPALSPDGTRLAFSMHEAAEQVTVGVKQLGQGGPGDVGSEVDFHGVGGLSKWVMPHFRTDDALLVSQPTRSPQCDAATGCGVVERWLTTFEVALDGTRSGDVRQVLGVGGTGRMAVSDVYVHPTDRSLVAGHGQFNKVGEGAPTCATSCADVYQDPYPFVFDLDSGDYWIYQPRTTEPEYGSGAGLPFTGCAHVFWTPDGSGLVCSEQGTQALADAGAGNRIFTFPVDPRSDPKKQVLPIDAQPVFEHAAPAELFDLGANEQCDTYYHKYAEFCGGPTGVVASVVCLCKTPQCMQRAGSTEGEVLGSRVYLIDASRTSSPVYVDLTAELEEALGKRSGEMRSFTATCSASGGGAVSSGDQQQAGPSKTSGGDRQRPR